MTGSGSLARNSVINLTGFALPAVVALLAMPFLIKGLGTERFGLLALAWATLGYFNVFNLGIGRAVTQLTAGLKPESREDGASSLTDTAFLLLAASGFLAGLLLTVGAGWLVDWLEVVPAMRTEALRTFFILALGLPFVVSAAAFIGVLEADQRFATINLVRVPTSILSFVGPLLVLPFSRSVITIVSLLITLRVAAWIAYAIVYLRTIRRPGKRLTLEMSSARRLLRFGGWMTATNATVSLLDYFDRFLVGALISVTAVAFYVTPQEIVMRIAPLSVALGTVLFPAFSASLLTDPRRASDLFFRGFNVLLVLLFPIALFLVAFSEEILRLWLGVEFAVNSGPVLSWLAVAVLVSGLAQVPSTFIQGAGRPDLLAKLLALELPIYLAGLYWLTIRWGIEGAAIAWAVRVTLDFFASLYIAEHLSHSSGVLRRVIPLTAAALACLGIVAFPDRLVAKTVTFVLIGAVFSLSAWRWLLHSGDREKLLWILRLPFTPGGRSAAGKL